MGNPDHVDPSRLPNFRWAEDAHWVSRSTRIAINYDYRLVIDNLMDLSHIGYVHRTTIGTANDGEHATVETLTSEDHVTVRRWLVNQPPAATYAKKLRTSRKFVRWQLIEFRAPCYLRTFKGIGSGIYGTPGFGFDSVDVDPPGGITVSRGCTSATPETAASTHYFMVHSYYQENDEKLVETIWHDAVETLHQDKVILELTQRNMERLPDAPMISIKVDEGPSKARRLMRMALAESSRATRG